MNPRALCILFIIAIGASALWASTLPTNEAKARTHEAIETAWAGEAELIEFSDGTKCVALASRKGAALQCDFHGHDDPIFGR